MTAAAGAYRVEKMSYAGKRPHLDKSCIIYNASITLAGIPEAAHEYQLGSRSALDWLIDRYQVRTHKASGIVNDPNDWCAEQGQPALHPRPGEARDDRQPPHGGDRAVFAGMV